MSVLKGSGGGGGAGRKLGLGFRPCVYGGGVRL